MILKFSASGYLLHLPFGAIGPFGLHESRCTLEFQLHPHWLALELILVDRQGTENLAQLQFSMYMDALTAQETMMSPSQFLLGG